MRLRSLWVAIACFALAVPLVHAQTTGAISGWVRDGQGGAIPGATVTITSPNMPLGRSATSQGDGSFQFSGLLPGTYRLRAELSGMGIFQQDVVVSLAKETEVRAVLRATATAEVTVTAATPQVDTKSTTVSNVTDRAAIEKLPLARTFAGTMQLAPGVADSGVAISNTNPGFNAGGGRQDNQFLYDGVNVTNPFFGDLFQDFAELDIQEVNITRAGVSPEYGRTGGFIVNGVTKSGTNNFHGDARVEWQPKSLASDSKDPNATSEFNRVRPGASIGGPLWPDHLFFYGSANFYRQTEDNRFNNFNGVGNAPNGLPESDLDINEYFGKLTGTPASNQLIEASFRYRGVKQTNADITSRGSASTGDNPKEIDRIGVASWFWTVSSRFNVEAKFNHNENHNGAVPSTILGYQPAFNATNPALVGHYSPGDGTNLGGATLGINNDDFFRDEYKVTTSYLANFLGASHDVRVGASFSRNREELARIANGWGDITPVTSAGSCGAANASRCLRARFSPDQPAQVSKANTWGAFFQDQMTWSGLTVNLGVLVNQDKYTPQGGYFVFMSGDITVPNSVALPTCASGVTGACTYRDTLTIPFSKQFQPRIGVSYEIDHTAHDKVYANFARYDNLDNQSISRAAAPFRLLRVDAFFNLTTGAFIGQTIRANQQDKRVIPNIDPTYTDEYLVGYARPLGEGLSVEAWGMYRGTRDVIEDFAATGNNFTQVNPGNFRYGNLKDAYRKYRAATVELRKTGANNRWTADLSYTLSRLEGNWDLDYASQLFYASSYIEDGPGINVEDDARYGILEGDRTHVAKLFGSYTLPTNTIVGGYLRFQSGRPWQAQKYDPFYGVPYQYVETAGTRRLPSWTNFDLLVAQNIPLGGVGNLRLEGRLLNVFNSQPALSVDKVLFSNTANTTPNTNFGHALTYAAPRRFLATGTFSF